MKLEFLDNMNGSGRFQNVTSNQLLRLYDFDSTQALLLKTTIEKEIIKANKRVDFSFLSFIEAVNCNLIFSISDTDQGLTTAEKKNFECNLTISAYERMVDLIKPFCKGAGGYQWLYELDCPIDLLLSPGGTW